MSSGADSTVGQANRLHPCATAGSAFRGKGKSPGETGLRAARSAAAAACEEAAPGRGAAPPPSGIPKVEMADKDARTCLVKVGDVLPDAKLPDLAGKEQRLHDLYGPRLTIVFFWNAEGPYGIEELQDMANGLCAAL